jgi:hypothetical protein
MRGRRVSLIGFFTSYHSFFILKYDSLLTRNSDYCLTHEFDSLIANELIAILWQIGQGFLSSLREDAKVSQME